MPSVTLSSEWAQAAAPARDPEREVAACGGGPRGHERRLMEKVIEFELPLKSFRNPPHMAYC
jgi:hypothetical protein